MTVDRFHLMNVFVAVAEEEGFAAGARRLRMSPPAVTRAVAALEERLGVKLLNRTTRYVRTTDAGQRYLDDARRIISEANAADEAAAGVNAEPRGHLAVTAPVLFGRMFVMPGIVEYLERYPGTDVSALFLDRVVSLLDEGLDVGVRIGELPDSSMRALQVGSVRHVLCASPEHLQRYGLPRRPEDLHEHPIISSSAGSFSLDWRFEGKTLRYKPRLTVTTNDAAIEAAVRSFVSFKGFRVFTKLIVNKAEIIQQAAPETSIIDLIRYFDAGPESIGCYDVFAHLPVHKTNVTESLAFFSSITQFTLQCQSAVVILESQGVIAQAFVAVTDISQCDRFSGAITGLPVQLQRLLEQRQGLARANRLIYLVRLFSEFRRVLRLCIVSRDVYDWQKKYNHPDDGTGFVPTIEPAVGHSALLVDADGYCF